MFSATFYSPVTNIAACGYIFRQLSETWTAKHGAAAGTLAYNNSGVTASVITQPITENYWNYFARGLVCFNVSGLPSVFTVISAKVRLFADDSANQIGGSPSINIYSFSPADPWNISIDDYNDFGTTPFCDTPIAVPLPAPDDWNEWDFNADGKATIANGVLTYGVRLNWDATDSEPAWISNKQTYGTFMGRLPAATKPQLVVTYFTPKIFYF